MDVFSSSLKKRISIFSKSSFFKIRCHQKEDYKTRPMVQPTWLSRQFISGSCLSKFELKFSFSREIIQQSPTNFDLLRFWNLMSSNRDEYHLSHGGLHLIKLLLIVEIFDNQSSLLLTAWTFSSLWEKKVHFFALRNRISSEIGCGYMINDPTLIDVLWLFLEIWPTDIFAKIFPWNQIPNLRPNLFGFLSFINLMSFDRYKRRNQNSGLHLILFCLVLKKKREFLCSITGALSSLSMEEKETQFKIRKFYSLKFESQLKKKPLARIQGKNLQNLSKF